MVLLNSIVLILATFGFYASEGCPCTFESADICGYKIRSADGITWRRMQAKNAKFGPVVDNTYGTSEGHYLMATSSKNARLSTSNKAYLIIPKVPSTGIKLSCVRFWYQMAGEGPVSLNFYVRTPGGVLSSYPLWSVSTLRANNTWRVGQRSVDANYVHEIVFQAVMNRYESGFIALDDIVIKESACPPLGNCDFEEDLCTWQNAKSGVDTEWVRNNGPTPTNGTGPSVDHTLGKEEGSYVYLQADNPDNRRNLLGILQSEYFTLSTDRCLSFWGHMSGSEMGSLRVNLNYYDDQIPSLEKTVLFIEGDQGKDWFSRKIPINVDGLENQEYQILFIGRTKGRLSDIALDDIEITAEKCVPEIDCTLCKQYCTL